MKETNERKFESIEDVSMFLLHEKGCTDEETKGLLKFFS